MHVWIVLLSLFMPSLPAPAEDVVMSDPAPDEGPMRYRGIERLLAKFEAEETPRKARDK